MHTVIEGSDRKIPERAAVSRLLGANSEPWRGDEHPVTSGDARAATWAVLVPSQAAEEA